MHTRVDALLEQLGSYSTRAAIEDRDQRHSYADLLGEVERWRLRLRAQKVEPGMVVGLCADYSHSAIAALIALFAERAVAALIPRGDNMDLYLKDACASVALQIAVDGQCEWRCVQAGCSDHSLLERLRGSSQGGVVIFTSGSTGRPKAALQSTERFLHKFAKPGRSLRTLAFLLFDHVAGLDTLFYTLSHGGTLLLTRQRDPQSICRLIESHRVEVLPGSPSFLRLLCTAGTTDAHDLSSLKIITYGSEPMDPSTLAQLNARFPQVQLAQKYGTTETGSPRTISRGNDSLWLKFKNDTVETKVVDGVLWIRSEGTILGYLNQGSPFDEQGWYCTGDMVDVDGEWIRFRGRITDVINVGGEKVAPAEVEQVILELDFVGSAVVSGEPHALLGKVVTACVALSNAATDAKEATRRIRLHCRQRLAAYKVPVKISVATDTLVNERQKARRHLPE